METKRPRAAGSLACLLAAVLSMGGHWAVLQCVAWMGMVIEFSATDTLWTAVSKTLDGRHPCALCLKIRDGREREQGTPAAVPTLKETLASAAVREEAAAVMPWPPEGGAPCVGYVPVFHSEFIDGPPSPPPRA